MNDLLALLLLVRFSKQEAPLGNQRTGKRERSALFFPSPSLCTDLAVCDFLCQRPQLVAWLFHSYCSLALPLHA
jgi:hypothetical protein